MLLFYLVLHPNTANVFVISALHHNNCMFVAHHLMTLDKTFRNKLVASSHPAAKEATLDDLVPKVRRLGNDSFSEHIDIKKEQLCDHLCMASGNDPIGNIQFSLYRNAECCHLWTCSSMMFDLER
jgi:hypothetical protein